jgi:AcrR family transcriptional regulator
MSPRAAEATAQQRAGEPVALTPILSAALDAFNEHGYSGATVRDIARRVGVTVPALYYHHENKEALLYSLLDASISRLAVLCREADEADPDPGHRFEGLVDCLVRYTAASGKLSHLDAEIRSLSPQHRRSYSAKRAELEGRLLSAVEDGQRRGDFELDFPRDTVRALLGMIQSITTWYRPEGQMTADDLAERYLVIAGRMAGRRIR